MAPPLPSPAPSFDDPIELLLACHGKVRHFAQLALRLRDHVAAHGVDGQAREAATAVLRYFERAAPLHHQDEEQDLFAALRALGDGTLTAQLDALQAEHPRLDRLWAEVRPWLQAVAQGQAEPAPAQVGEFAAAELAHAEREETAVYPQAARLDSAQCRELGRRMAARRTTR